MMHFNKFTKSILFILVIFVYVFSICLPVFAEILPDDQNAIDLDTVWHKTYDDENGAECSEAQTPAPGSPINIIGNDNTEKTYRFFISKGLTSEQSSGIVGNAYAESGINPKSVSKNGNYSGMFQWDTNGRFANLKKWTASKGLDPLSLEGQLEFAFYEAESRGNIAGIKQQNTVELAAWYWGRFFEVAIIGGSTSKTPLTNVQALKKRTDYAISVHAKYGATTTPPPTTPDPTIPTAPIDCGGSGGGESTKYIDGFTVYSQYDPIWKNNAYGSSTIGESGCGPAAMAMIITTLTGSAVTPAITAPYAASIGMYVPGSGSAWAVGPRLAEHWNLKSEPIERDLGKMTAALQQGKLIITPGSGAKPFTSGGHFIVIRAITASGNFLVGDSGHGDTSDKEWPPGPIISNMRSGGAYAISK